jgi:hypothetical protein
MEIETDDVVKEYIFRLTSQILPLSKMKRSDKNFLLLERTLMIGLEGMVATGAADHKYDEARKVDSFISTERLVQNWSWMFPGDKFNIDRSKRHVFEIKGKRAKYFNDRWLTPDPNKFYPFYPHVAKLA